MPNPPPLQGLNFSQLWYQEYKSRKTELYSNMTPHLVTNKNSGMFSQKLLLNTLLNPFKSQEWPRKIFS